MTEPANEQTPDRPVGPGQGQSSAIDAALPGAAGERKVSRARLLIHLLTFQLKLVADGLRDVLLFPVAFAAAVFGLLFGGDQPDYYFRKLMSFGQRTDRFINLFGQHDEAAPNTQDTPTADELLAPYQQQLLERATDSKTAGKVSDLVDGLSTQRESK